MLPQVVNVPTGAPELAIPLENAARCVCATSHSLIAGTGGHALMYGKATGHFGWREPPSFEFVSKLIASDEHGLRCVAPLIAAHPLLPNCLDRHTGKTLLQFAIERSSDEELVSHLLTRSHTLAMTRDVDGNTGLHAAIEMGRRRAVRLLLTAATDGRVSLIPDSLEPIINLFGAIAHQYPAEFFDFLCGMPLDEEKQVLEAIRTGGHVCGDGMCGIPCAGWHWMRRSRYVR